MAIDAGMLTQRSAQRNGQARGQPCALAGPAPSPTPVAAPVAMLVPPVTARPGRARIRAGRGVFGTRRARQQFLDALARQGDPAVVAEAMNLSLVRLFHLRAEDAEFAAAWHAAIGFAWERVEHRVLAGLLDPAAGVDSKLALAILARRDAGTARVQGRRVDSAAVARVRAELRALAGPAQD